MLFRAAHCLPIVLKTKHKNQTFNKYEEKALSCDAIFNKDDYSTFQFIQYKFASNEFMTKLPTKLDKWSHKHFGCDANIESSDESVSKFVRDIVKQNPVYGSDKKHIYSYYFQKQPN